MPEWLHFSALLLSAVAVHYLARRLALKVGLVDRPDARKVHSDAVPMSGGVAIVSVTCLAALLWPAETPYIGQLLWLSLLIAAVGVTDDFLDVSPLIRFGVQIAACLWLIEMSGVRIDTFGALLWPGNEARLGAWAVAVTVFGVVGIINALNMSDGIDALAAGYFLQALVVLMGLGLQDPVLHALLIAVAVFIGFNKSRSGRMFLGDAGSMWLGFVLAWLLVYASSPAVGLILPVSALWFIALPLYDTIYVMLRRLLNGRSPFQPDKKHLHHLLLALNLGHTGALLLLLLLQLMLTVAGWLMMQQGVPAHVQFYLFVLLSLGYYVLMDVSWRRVGEFT